MPEISVEALINESAVVVYHRSEKEKRAKKLKY